MKVRKTRQRDMTDCGAACLAAVAAHHGLNVTVAAVRQAAGTDRHGTTVLGLIHAAERLGLSAKGVRGKAEFFISQILPVILHLRLPNGLEHFVVLVGISATHARIMDPMDGEFHRLSREEFAAQWTGIAVLLAPKPESVPSARADTGPVGLFSRVRAILRPHKTLLAQSLLGALVTALLALAMSVYVRNVVDHVIGDGNLPLLNVLSLAMLAVVSLRSVLLWLQNRLHHRITLQIDARLLADFHRHLLSLPQQFFDSMRVGEVLSRFTDAMRIRIFLNEIALQLVINTLLIGFSLAFMLMISLPLAAGFAGLIVAFAGLFFIAIKVNRASSRAQVEAFAEYGAEISETLQTAATVKRLALEPTVGLRSEIKLVNMLRQSDGLAKQGLIFAGISGWLGQTCLVGLLWWGSTLVLDTKLTPGELLSCYTLAAFMIGPLNVLFGAVGSLQQARIAADRLFEIMDLEVESTEGMLQLNGHLGEGIELQGLTFAHPGRMHILNNVSMRMPAGRISVLVGESGCGKSTVLSLLQRLYPPNAGVIRLDGQDLAHFRLPELRGQIAMVPQKVELFTDTIMGNIVIGDPNPDFVRAMGICRRLDLHDFIERLPLKYATPVRESGSNFSGGQRQKIAIARALYRNTSILIMDEPSSALDHESESLLLEMLVELSHQGVTVVIAAHNQRVAEIADVVFEFRNGAVSVQSKDPAVRSIRDQSEVG